MKSFENSENIWRIFLVEHEERAAGGRTLKEEERKFLRIFGKYSENIG